MMTARCAQNTCKLRRQQKEKVQEMAMTLFGINICAILLIQNATHISLSPSKSKDALMFAVTQGKKKACQICDSTHLSDFHLFRVKIKTPYLTYSTYSPYSSKLLRKITFKNDHY